MIANEIVQLNIQSTVPMKKFLMQKHDIFLLGSDLNKEYIVMFVEE